MEYLHRLVEDRIQKAQDEGAFDNLAGKGKPLNLDDDSAIPEDLRLTFKVLKNAHCLPIEMEMRKEIFNLGQLVNAAIDPAARRELRRELNVMILDVDPHSHITLDEQLQLYDTFLELEKLPNIKTLVVIAHDLNWQDQSDPLPDDGRL